MKRFILLFLLACQGISTTYAATQPNLGTTIVAFPTHSALMTPTLDKQIQANPNNYPGSINAHLAYQQRDLAWKKAQEVLSTIAQGNFNNQYIMANTLTKYSAFFISNSQKWATARRIIASSGPNAANLSLANEGKYSDYLKITAPSNQNQVYMAIVHYFPGCNNQKCIYSIVGLIANPPYKNWKLVGLHLFSNTKK